MKIVSEDTNVTENQKIANISKIVGKYRPQLKNVNPEYMLKGISTLYNVLDDFITSTEVPEIILDGKDSGIDSLTMMNISLSVEEKLKISLDGYDYFDVFLDGIKKSDYNKVIPYLCKELQKQRISPVAKV